MQILQSFGNLKHINETIPYIKRILKKLNYSDEHLKLVMTDSEETKSFAHILYEELPTHLKLKVKEADFVRLMEEKAKEQMKKKKNKKKVFG